MRKLTRLSLGIGGCLLMALAGGLAGFTLLARTQGQTPEIASPDSWVPFAADMLHQEPGSTDGVGGRFYRRSDGSTRSETWSLSDPLKSVVEIRNIPESTYYVKRLNNRWQRHPMKLPAGGWYPPKMRVGTVGLQRSPIVVEHMEVYRLVGSRIVEFRAPQLNFFPVVVADPVTGSTKKYFNITKGEPDPILFTPPGGVTIEGRPEPMGIVVGGGADLQGPAGKTGCCGEGRPATQQPKLK